MRPKGRMWYRLILWGAVLFIIAGVSLTKDRFVFTHGSQKTVITRQKDPGIYWGTEAGLLCVASLLMGGGVYRYRKTRQL